jgi:hypothetical protein
MKWRPIIAVLVTLVAFAAPAHSTGPGRKPATRPAPPDQRPQADAGAEEHEAEYIEYRASAELGHITISNGSVRGEVRVKHLSSRADELAKKGIFPCTDEKRPRVHRRREKMGGRTIDTAIIIRPPTGEGDDGEYWTQRLFVSIDGRRKLNCTIGTTADGELWVSQVVLHPEDGTLTILALSADGLELGLPEGWDSLDDPHVITDDAFFEDAPPEGPGGPPLKA